MPLIAIGSWSAVLLFLSLTISGVFGFYAGTFYWFTIPFHLVAGTCVIATIFGLLAPTKNEFVFWMVAPVHAAMVVSFSLAMSK